MRVLLYLSDNQWSGCARATLMAGRGLAARGHQVTISCPSGSRLDRLAAESSIERVAINSATSAASGAWDLRRVLKDRFIEVAIVHTERDHLVVGSAMRFAGRGGVLRRLPSFEKIEHRRGGKFALSMAAAGILVSTERELRELNATGWTIPASVVPLGVDVEISDGIEAVARNEIGVPSRGRLIACAYDPSGRYRLGVVFRTLALLASRRANIHIAVFGPGSDDDELRVHAAALGVGSVTSFLGARDDEQRVMRAASAGWVVSGGDNAAFALLDLMALRVPVIADRSPLAKHYVADGISGVLLEPNDASHVASGVAAFLASEDNLLAMGKAGRTRVQREFPDGAMIDGFERAVNAAGDRTKWSKQ